MMVSFEKLGYLVHSVISSGVWLNKWKPEEAHVEEAEAGKHVAVILDSVLS